MVWYGMVGEGARVIKDEEKVLRRGRTVMRTERWVVVITLYVSA